MLLSLIATLFILSALVCIYDWRFRLIPNYIVMIIFGISLVTIFANKDYLHFVYFLLLMPISILIWKLGIWGAGDSKLLLAFFPMIDTQYYLLTVCFIGFLGAVTVVVFLISKSLFNNNKFNTVPYGIPIALSCFLTSIASF